MPKLERTTNGGWKARKRIPSDARADYKRLYGQGHELKLTIPPGRSAGEAKRAYGDWLSEHEQRVTAIRAALRGEGIDLTHKDALALAGQWYVWFTGRHEDTPGDPKRWDGLQWQFFDTLKEHLPVGLLEQSREHSAQDVDEWTHHPAVRAAMRPFVADHGHTAQFLARRDVVLTNAGQIEFLGRVLDLYWSALQLVERRALGDYRADDLPQEFPAFARDARRPSGISFVELFRKWVEAKQPQQSTVESWRVVFNALTRDFKDRGPEDLSATEAQAWIESLVTPQRHASTVNKTWVGAVKAVVAWGVKRKQLSRNPFTDVALDVPKRPRRRETKAFDEDELRIILRAASASQDTSTADLAAKRWVPWLLAYTGARPSEITQLRKEDVKETDGVDFVELTPDAGSIKSGKGRRVPLHPHLLDQGFLTFVKQKGSGPLFYKPRRTVSGAGLSTKMPKPPAAQARQRLAKWVRDLGVTDKELSPNHAWRHTFKRIGRSADLNDTLLDYICGHAPSTEGRAYGEPTLKEKAKAIARFPRYDVDATL